MGSRDPGKRDAPSQGASEAKDIKKQGVRAGAERGGDPSGRASRVCSGERDAQEATVRDVPQTPNEAPQDGQEGAAAVPAEARNGPVGVKAAEEVPSVECGKRARGEDGSGCSGSGQEGGLEEADHVGEMGDEDVDDHEDEADGKGKGKGSKSTKKPRLVWTSELHSRFMNAVNHLGVKNAVPKTILQLMNVEGMTRENVASHLQKYRLYLKRVAGLPPSARLPAEFHGMQPAYQFPDLQQMMGPPPQGVMMMPPPHPGMPPGMPMPPYGYYPPYGMPWWGGVGMVVPGGRGAGAGELGATAGGTEGGGREDRADEEGDGAEGKGGAGAGDGDEGKALP